MKTYRLILAMTACMFLFQSCTKDDDKKDPDPVTPETYDPGKVILEFSTMVNGSGVHVNDNTSYANSIGQNYKISLLKYYISNVELVKEDGSTYVVPDVYSLVTGGTTSHKMTFNDVPGGIYTGVKFKMGVDAARTAAGNFTGDLDASNGMYWNSTDGFIFMKFEGTAVSSPTGTFSYNIGGQSALKSYNLSFSGQKLTVDGPRMAQIHIFGEVPEILKTPNAIDFSSTNSIDGPGNGNSIADNYQDMFTFNHLHN